MGRNLREFDVHGFIDEMRMQDITNRLVERVSDSRRKAPADAFSQEEIADILMYVPQGLEVYGSRIPVVKQRFGGDRYDFRLPFKETIDFDPEQKIIDIFNPENKTVEPWNPFELADLSLTQLFNQTGRPRGIVIATESLTGLKGSYYLRSFAMKGDTFRNVREGSIGYHPNVHLGLDNPRDTTLRNFVQLIASAIVHHDL